MLEAMIEKSGYMELQKRTTRWAFIKSKDLLST